MYNDDKPIERVYMQVAAGSQCWLVKNRMGDGCHVSQHRSMATPLGPLDPNGEGAAALVFSFSLVALREAEFAEFVNGFGLFMV